MALMQINILPLGTSSPSVGEFVASIVKRLRKEGVDCRLTDMGTVIEGSVEGLLAVAARLHEVPFNKGCRRVVTQILIDDRRDKKIGLGDKIASVNQRLELEGE
jgi:uncharacterized protein (TIGR00106 family)